MPSSVTGNGYLLVLPGATIPLPDRALIGRGPACDVPVLNDPLVSRRHARLVVCAHGVVIEDLSSTNGTYVEGERVGSRLLAGRESIRVGNTDLLLSCTSGERTEPRLDWDDETLSGKPPSSASGKRRATSTTSSSIFEVLSSLAEKALLAGDNELAARIVRARRLDQSALATYLRGVRGSADRLAPKDRLRFCRLETLARIRQTG